MAWTQEKIETTLQSVVEKAQEDAAFREKLKSSPKEALEAEAGEMIPEFIRIAIVDQNDADIVITLPKVQSDELSDADLEQVAGGKGETKNCNVAFDYAGEFGRLSKEERTSAAERVLCGIAITCVGLVATLSAITG